MVCVWVWGGLRALLGERVLGKRERWQALLPTSVVNEDTVSALPQTKTNYWREERERTGGEGSCEGKHYPPPGEQLA